MPGMSRPVRPINRGSEPTARLSERQAMVLRALVTAYVGQAGPVASGTLSHLIPTQLSPASIRNTLVELHEAGLIDKAHASAGRIPTPLGMGVFIDHLLDLADLAPYERRMLDRALDGVDAAEMPRQTSQLLSQTTRMLGFVMAPRVEYLRMRSVHLVSVGAQRVLAVLVAENGGVIQRIFDHSEQLSTRELERVGALLAERVAGKALFDLRRALEDEREQLKGEASAWMRRVWSLGLSACQGEEADDLVVATRTTLLDQPEFSDPERIRALFAALETNQQLLELSRKIAQTDRGGGQVGLSMSIGQELGEPSLRNCALVVVHYGRRSSMDRASVLASATLGNLGTSGEATSEDAALGVLGVIGPQRMDYGRVIPLVSYCADLATRKLLA